MPITLGCPSCGKRFRARDESAGKRVKCPFCQAAVPVPSSADAEAAGAPTEVVPAPPDSEAGSTASPAPRELGLFDVANIPPRAAPAAPVPAASPDDWGAPPAPLPTAGEPRPPFPPPTPPKPPVPPPPARKGRTATRDVAAKSPEEQAAAGWHRASGGLFWVLFGVFWIALIGFVPFGKLVYERSVGPLPAGEGWVKIDGYVNQGQDAIRLDKPDEINVLLYGIPLAIGGLAIVLGRLTAGAVPRTCGAKGLFAFSGLFALLALAGFATWKVCERVAFREVAGYGWWGAVVGAALSEFWFLLALGAAAATLRRPKAVRGVGLFALVLGLAVVLYFVGWEVYLDKIGPEIGRPRPVEAGSDWLLYEAAAGMLGWLVLVGAYWRAVRGVRLAMKDYTADSPGKPVKSSGAVEAGAWSRN